MKKTSFIIILILLIDIRLVMSDPKDIYKEVDRVVWVVEDVRSVINGWKSLGFSQFIDYGKVSLLQLNGGSIDVYLVSGNLGGVKITWIQPVSRDNVFYSFLEKNGDGAFALLHRVPGIEEMNKEIDRLQKKGVDVLHKGKVEADQGSVTYTMMNTTKKGKYVLGLIHGPDDLETLPGDNTLDMRFNQYAFAIEDPKPVSDYWSGLGFPEMEITFSDGWGKEYYGQPADFTMNLGWQRHGSIVYEWCIPLKGPTVYEDHIKEYGEGIQHFGFAVSDMDKAIDYFQDKGYEVSMSGGWGDKGKPGSGRFAYVNTEKIGGESIELLWSYNE